MKAGCGTARSPSTDVFVHLQEIFQEYGEPSVAKNLVELQGNSLQVHRNLVSHKVAAQ